MYTLNEIVARFGGEVLGDASVRIVQVATLEGARADQISFFNNPRYRRQLEQTSAGAVIISREAAEFTSRPRIVCDDPMLTSARLSASSTRRSRQQGPSQCRDPRYGAGRPDCIDRPLRGDRSRSSVPAARRRRLQSGREREPRRGLPAVCERGGSSRLCHRRPCCPHAGAVIGADGFGIAWAGRWCKIPQIGRVLIGDDVEVEPIRRSIVVRWTTR
jgi:UDP-3-O-[3-hydroxymyristoyl] glucosamine N-acyltransferase